MRIRRAARQIRSTHAENSVSEEASEQGNRGKGTCDPRAHLPPRGNRAELFERIQALDRGYSFGAVHRRAREHDHADAFPEISDGAEPGESKATQRRANREMG